MRDVMLTEKMMSEEKFNTYNEINNALIAESIRCSPEAWKAGTLTIDCDGTRIDYKLKNPGEDEKAQISDELRQLCEQLYVTMRENGDVWIRATFSFSQKDDDWSFEGNFEYEKDQVNESAIAQDSQKPWWKIW